jgi:hypothetical protein
VILIDFFGADFTDDAELAFSVVVQVHFCRRHTQTNADKKRHIAAQPPREKTAPALRGNRLSSLRDKILIYCL